MDDGTTQNIFDPQLEELKISRTSKGFLRAFDVLINFLRKGSQENFRTYRIVIPPSGYYDVEVGANTMQVIIANSNGFLDGTKIRLGELSFTYPTAEVQLDNFQLPKVGMGFRIYGIVGTEYLITESVHHNRLINNNLLNVSVTTERLTAYKKIVLYDDATNPIFVAPGANYTTPMFDATGYAIGLFYMSYVNNNSVSGSINVQTIFNFGADFQDGTSNTFTTYLNTGGVNNGSSQVMSFNYNYGGYRTALIGNTTFQISNPSASTGFLTIGYIGVRLMQGVNS